MRKFFKRDQKEPEPERELNLSDSLDRMIYREKLELECIQEELDQLKFKKAAAQKEYTEALRKQYQEETGSIAVADFPECDVKMEIPLLGYVKWLEEKLHKHMSP